MEGFKEGAVDKIFNRVFGFDLEVENVSSSIKAFYMQANDLLHVVEVDHVNDVFLTEQHYLLRNKLFSFVEEDEFISCDFKSF